MYDLFGQLLFFKYFIFFGIYMYLFNKDNNYYKIMIFLFNNNPYLYII